MSQPEFSTYAGVVSDLSSFESLWLFVTADLRILLVVSLVWWVVPLNPKTLTTAPSRSRGSLFRAAMGSVLSLPLLIWSLIALRDTLKIASTQSVVPEHTVFVQSLEALSSMLSFVFVIIAGVSVAGVFAWFRVQVPRPSWSIFPALLGVFSTLLIQASFLYYYFLVFLDYIGSS